MKGGLFIKKLKWHCFQKAVSKLLQLQMFIQYDKGKKLKTQFFKGGTLMKYTLLIAALISAPLLVTMPAMAKSDAAQDSYQEASRMLETAYRHVESAKNATKEAKEKLTSTTEKTHTFAGQHAHRANIEAGNEESRRLRRCI